MSVPKYVIALLLFVGPTWAGEPPGRLADSTSGGVTTPPVGVDEVLALAPADAIFIAYAAEAKTAFAHPVLAEIFSSVRSDLQPLVDALPRTFDSGVMISLNGVLADPLTWQITLAARIGVDREELFRRLADEIIPAWNRCGKVPGQLQWWDDGRLGYLQLTRPVPLLMTFAVRDDIVLASNMLGAVDQWGERGEAGERFVDTEDFARLNTSRSEPVGTLLYQDTSVLLPRVAASLDESLPGLFEALQLGRIEFIALIGGKMCETAPEPKATRPPEPEDHGDAAARAKAREPVPGQRLRLAIGLDPIAPGPWHLLASAPRPVSLANLFPEDTTIFIHGSMERASSIVDDIRAFAGAIDKEITDEYEQELAEFTREVGVDLQAEFLANFVNEWAFGLRVQPFGNRLLALRLDSPAMFQAHMHRLRLFYQLGISPTTHRGITIERAARPASPFSYAVVENVLLVSPDDPTIHRAIDAFLDGRHLAGTKAFERVLERSAPRTSKFVFVNLADLLAEVLESPQAARFPRFVELVKAGAGMGLSVVPYERMIALEIVASEGPPGRVVDVLASVLLPSLQRARELSRRAVSLANAKSIVISCKIYEADHERQWPRSLDQLVATGVMGDKADAMKILSNPYEPGEDTAEKPYYLYRYIADPKAVKDPSQEVVVSEPEIHDGGAVFGFMDGHVEWVTSPRAEELLAVMRRGQ